MIFQKCRFLLLVEQPILWRDHAYSCHYTRLIWKTLLSRRDMASTHTGKCSTASCALPCSPGEVIPFHLTVTWICQSVSQQWGSRNDNLEDMDMPQRRHAGRCAVRCVEFLSCVRGDGANRIPVRRGQDHCRLSGRWRHRHHGAPARAAPREAMGQAGGCRE